MELKSRGIGVMSCCTCYLEKWFRTGKKSIFLLGVYKNKICAFTTAQTDRKWLVVYTLCTTKGTNLSG